MRIISVLLLLAIVTKADGPKDNLPDNVRPIPPKGAAIPDYQRKDLLVDLSKLGDLLVSMRNKPEFAEHLPDVEVFLKAVITALRDDEMYVDKNRDDVKVCKALIKLGLERGEALRNGKTPWLRQTGLVVRGYKSKIDDSFQPYGL